VINPVDKSRNFKSYDSNRNTVTYKPVTNSQVLNVRIIAEPSCVINISKDYYMMMKMVGAK
jgi:hypothetical protein